MLPDELQAILQQLSLTGDRQDVPRQIELCRRALKLCDRDVFPEVWAYLHRWLAFIFVQNLQGDWSVNLEQAIKHLEQTLQVYTPNAFPEEWASIQDDLGNAYTHRIQGDHAENLEQAIKHFELALQVCTSDSYSEQWAQSQHNLGVAYMNRIKGNRAANLEQAIEHHQLALQVYTRRIYPQQWAQSHGNLGVAFADRVIGDRADNLEQAIHHYRQALKIYTLRDYQVQWALIQQKLGNAHRHRLRGDPALNLEQAIEHFKHALQVYTRDTFQEQWAENHGNLADSYRHRIQGERSENLERAICHYQQALQVYNRENNTGAWAALQIDLADSFSNRIQGERSNNLEQALHHYHQALEVVTHEARPEIWARIQYNLALAYANRICGDRADNLEQAIHHYQQSLKVRTRQAFPEQWAEVQHNLGFAYWDRIQGERSNNLEQALHHYHQALEVYTQADFPNQWAHTLTHLALAYANRIRGDRWDNLEQARHHALLVLTVYTREDFPVQRATVQTDLGPIYLERIAGDRADNLEQAIHHCHQALEVRTRQAFPADWAMTQHNLATAYLERIAGDRADNLEQAIYHYRQALKVRTRQDFPADWAMTQHNLAVVYFERIHGYRADNLEQAIYHYRQALKVRTRQDFPEQWADTLNSLANTYEARLCRRRAKNLRVAINLFEQALEVFTLNQFPVKHRLTRRNLGRLHFDEGNWERAHMAYAGAIEAGTVLLAESHTSTGRWNEVRETSRLHARDAYCLLHLKDPGQALLRLDQGKTRLLAEALALYEADVATLPEDQRQAIRAVRQALYGLRSEASLPPNTPARRNNYELNEALRQVRADLNHLIETIRIERPDFMSAGLDLPELLGLIPADGALVAPLVTSRGSAVFVLPQGCNRVTDAELVRLDHFTDAHLQTLLDAWVGAYANRRFDRNRWFDVIEATGQTLWDMLLGPVYERLRALDLGEGAPVLLMPQGGLGVLPLHAAWREVNGVKRAFLDDYTVSYAPSGYALSVSHRRLREPQRQQHSLLAVVNPTADLAFAPFEGKAVAAFFDKTMRQVLDHDDAALETVLRAGSGRNYLHFSCHGFYYRPDVKQPGLLMAGNVPLTFKQIIADFDLSASRLVTLSACETGVTESYRTPDEYWGLPASFLWAGAPAVVSSLWAVNDLSTMLVMERFYQSLFQDNLTLPTALREAQLWLRQLTRAKLLQYFDSLFADLPKEQALGLYTQFLTGIAGSGEYPYSRPYHWAPFVFHGT